MRTLMITVLSLLFTSFSFAQTTANNCDSANIEASSTNMNGKDLAELRLRHSKSAMSQLRSMISDNLAYDELMQANCSEGKVIVYVELNAEGKVRKYSVQQSDNVLLNKAVDKAMSKVSSIDIKDNKYRGKRKFNIPVTFRLS